MSSAVSRSWPEPHKVHTVGTHRTRHPRATLEYLEPLKEPAGITRVANITGLDRIGIPVAMVCRPNARSLSVSQGKGVDLTSAKASGLMEALELFHAEHIDRPLLEGSYHELASTQPLCDPDLCARSTERELDLDLSIPWIESLDLVSGDPSWVPFELVSTDFSLPLPANGGCFAANSNGLASGNHPTEAVCHGLAEVIERDAGTLAGLHTSRQRIAAGVDLSSVDDPTCRQVLRQFEEARIDVRVWNITSDVGVATFLCQISDDLGEPGDAEIGAGAHPNRDIALVRALTEAAQVRLTVIAGVRDDIPHWSYSRDQRRLRQRQSEHMKEMHSSTMRFSEAPTFESSSIACDVDWMLGRLGRVGLEQVLVVDLTRDDFGVPVVKVVVPGLEGLQDDEHGEYLPGPRARRRLESSG